MFCSPLLPIVGQDLLELLTLRNLPSGLGFGGGSPERHLAAGNVAPIQSQCFTNT